MKIKTEATKDYGLVGSESETLKQFEMLELKGGIQVSSGSDNYSCTNSNCNNSCCPKTNEADLSLISLHFKSDY